MSPMLKGDVKSKNLREQIVLCKNKSCPTRTREFPEDLAKKLVPSGQKLACPRCRSTSFLIIDDEYHYIVEGEITVGE